MVQAKESSSSTNPLDGKDDDHPSQRRRSVCSNPRAKWFGRCDRDDEDEGGCGYWRWLDGSPRYFGGDINWLGDDLEPLDPSDASFFDMNEAEMREWDAAYDAVVFVDEDYHGRARDARDWRKAKIEEQHKRTESESSSGSTQVVMMPDEDGSDLQNSPLELSKCCLTVRETTDGLTRFLLVFDVLESSAILS